MQNRLLKFLGRQTRRRFRAAVALVLIGALTLPAVSLAAGFTVTVHIADHTPIAGKRWPVELTITRGRQRLQGTVRYQFMFAGIVVRTQPQHGVFKFKNGVYRDQLVFPAQSIGQPLTLRFLVKTRYGTEHADWALKVQKPGGGNSQ